MKNLIAFLLISIPAILSGQASLSGLVSQIAGAVKEVGDEKITISQTIEADKTKPYRLTYTRRTTDAKGKSTEEKWEFNLADIDKNTVRWEDKKTAMLVVMRTNREQRFIKYLKNGVPDGYTDELTLQAKGIDNARELEKLFEDAVEPSREAWEKEANLQNRTPADLLNTLYKMVGEVSYDKQTAKQKLEHDGSSTFTDRLKLTVETFDAKGQSTKEAYFWSIGDLSDQSIRLAVQSDRVYVEAKTLRNIRWISSEKNGEVGSFENEVEILVSDPDQGKMVQAILQKLIPFGVEQIKKRLPQPTTSAEALRLMAATQQKFSRAKTAYEQTLKADCLTMATMRSTDEKKTELEEYPFHFGDLNEKTASLEIRGQNIGLEVGTVDNNKFIGYSLNGEGKNYTSKIEFLFPDVEQARLFEHLLPIAIGQCRQTPLAKDLDWLKKSLVETEKNTPGLTQKIELQTPGATCKWKFTRIETGEKKSTEELYEFNLYDLDPKQVKIGVNGRAISLDLQTKYRQKIISRYENSKPTYAADLSIAMPDLESAKIARETLVKVIEGCKQ